MRIFQGHFNQTYQLFWYSEFFHYFSQLSQIVLVYTQYQYVAQNQRTEVYNSTEEIR
jgi:hypothetical protein